MLRIGILGAESSHTGEVVRLLNTERRVDGVWVSGVVPVDAEASHVPAELVVADVETLIPTIDAAYVATRDGATHRALAEPLLAAGLPVWVDKPLTATLSDARALLDGARRAGSLIWSRSAVRDTPLLRRYAEAGRAGRIRHLHLVGPADPASPWSGIAFYGVHLLEAAVEVLGLTGWQEATVTAQESSGALVADMTVGGRRVTCTFVPPDQGRKIGFHAYAVVGHEVWSDHLALGPDYLLPTLRGFVAACASGRGADSDDLLAPVHLAELLRERTCHLETPWSRRQSS